MAKRNSDGYRLRVVPDRNVRWLAKQCGELLFDSKLLNEEVEEIIGPSKVRGLRGKLPECVLATIATPPRRDTDAFRGDRRIKVAGLVARPTFAGPTCAGGGTRHGGELINGRAVARWC